MPETPYPVVAVLATDWSFYGSERNISEAEDLTLIDGWTVGLLIHETDQTLVIAHQFFKGERTVRHTSVINKQTVKLRLTLGNGEKGHGHLPQEG